MPFALELCIYKPMLMQNNYVFIIDAVFSPSLPPGYNT